jgi:hypothetical protein
MTEYEDAFDIWKSRVDVYLEQMVKKSSGSFRYDYLNDFKNNIPPEETATRAIKSGYKGAKNGSNNIRSQTKR